MLDVRSAMDFSTRLMEALENARAPKGEGLVSDQRGPVPQEVAEAFRALLERPDSVRAAAPATRPEAASALRAPQALGEAPVAEGPGSTGTVEGRIREAVEPPLPTPEELLGTQFAVNMHVFESTLTANTRDRFLSDFEQLLKSNG